MYKSFVCCVLSLTAYSSALNADSRIGLTPDEVAFAQSVLKPKNNQVSLSQIFQSASPNAQKILALLNDKALVLTALTKNGLALQYVHPHLKDDVDVVMRAVQQNGLALVSASDRLKNNIGIVRVAVRSNPDALKFTSPKMQDDKVTVLMAVGNKGESYRGNHSFRYASPRLKNDKAVVLRATRQSDNVLQYTSDSLRNDPIIIQAILKNNGRDLQRVGDQIRNNKQFILKEVYKRPKNCGDAVSLASDKLKADRDFVLRVFQAKGCTRAFSQLPEKLRKDKVLAKVAIRQDGYFHLDLFDQSFKDDWSVIKLAPKDSQLPYQKFSKRLRKDKEIFKQVLAIQKYSVYQYADASIRDDKTLTLMALKVHGYDLKYASARLRQDYQVVKVAVSRASDALKYAHKSLRNNKKIVMYAVTANYPSGFEYASPSLKKDKEILAVVAKKIPRYAAYAKASSPLKQEVFAAVKNDGSALKFASKKFKKDKEIVWAAVRQNGHAIQYADKSLQNNTKLKYLAIKTSPDVLHYVFARNNTIKIDKELVIASLNESAFNFADLDKKYRVDKEVVLAAINSKSDGLNKINGITFVDDDIVNAFVDKSLIKPFGLRKFLHYLSKPVSSKSRLLRILKQDGLALEYASPEFKRDRAIVQTAVNQNGNAIAFVDSTFRLNKPMAKLAITKSKSGEAFDYIAPALQLDRELLLLAINKGNKNILRELNRLLSDNIAGNNSALAELQASNQGLKISKVRMDMSRFPDFYLSGSNHQKDAKFVLSDDKTRLAAIVDRRPQGVTQLGIWNTKTGHLLYSTRLPYSVLGYGNVSFTPDNKRLVAAGQGFIWSFSKAKQPVMCYLDSTILDINNQAVLMHPNDWVDGIYDLETCDPIVLANQMSIPQAVIGPQNKLLMLSIIPLSKEEKDIILYRKEPKHHEHYDNFRHIVDLWEIPLSKDKLNANTYTLHNSVKKYFITLRYDSQNTLTISKWDYMKKRLIWKKVIKNMKPLSKLVGKDDFLQDPLFKYQADFTHKRLYLADKNSVHIINLKNGRVIEKHAQAYKKTAMDYSGASPFLEAVVDALEKQGIATEEVRHNQNNGSSLYVTDYIFNIKGEEVSRVNLLNARNVSLWKVKRTQR